MNMVFNLPEIFKRLALNRKSLRLLKAQIMLATDLAYLSTRKNFEQQNPDVALKVRKSLNK